MSGYKNARKTEDLSGKLREAEENSGADDSQARIKINPGINVFVLAPGVGDMLLPLRHVLLHYNPFHICNRDDPGHKIVRGERVFETSKFFKDCHRCQTAWDSFVASGYTKGTPESMLPGDVVRYKKEIFKPNLSDNKTLIQVVDVSGFFKPGGANNDKAKVDKDLVKMWFEPFCDVMAGGDAPEGMPEAILNGAQAGLQIVVVNKTTGIGIEKAFVEYLYETAEEGNEQDPTHNPDTVLLKIVKVENPNARIDLPGGASRKGYSYDVSFTSGSDFKGEWCPRKVVESKLIPYIDSKMVDLLNLQGEDDGDLKTKAGRMLRLTEVEMHQLLDEDAVHSWSLDGNEQQDAPQQDAPAKLSAPTTLMEDEEIPF